MRLNTAPKSHRPQPVLRVGSKICRYAGGKCPRAHPNPIDAPTCSSHDEGACALVINYAMVSLILQPIHSLQPQFATQQSDRRHWILQQRLVEQDLWIWSCPQLPVLSVRQLAANAALQWSCPSSNQTVARDVDIVKRIKSQGWLGCEYSLDI